MRKAHLNIYIIYFLPKQIILYFLCIGNHSESTTKQESHFSHFPSSRYAFISITKQLTNLIKTAYKTLSKPNFHTSTA